MANTQIDITGNGTTTLATAGKYCDRNIDVNVAVRNGTHNRHYEVGNPTAILGAGEYITAISADELLSSIRDKKSLIVIYKTSGTVSCVKSVIALNESYQLPIYTQSYTNFQASMRFKADGGIHCSYVEYAINDDTRLSTGSGRVYITSDGDLRIYSNMNMYAIPAGTISIDVIWGDD